MASPDVAAYFGLDLVTLDEQTLVDTALANAVERFPDWEPREGNTEVVILEQVAALVAELGYLGNTIPDSTAEVLLRLLGRDRSTGTPPTASVELVVSDAAGHTIPAGTVFRVDLGESVEPVDLILDEDAVVAEGETVSPVVGLTGNEATTRANGFAGTVEVLDAIAYLDSVVLQDPIAGGTNAEDGTAFLERVGPSLNALTSTIVRPSDVAAFVLAEFPQVTRINVRDAGNASFVDPGDVNIYVLGDGGVMGVPAPTKTEIARALSLRMHGGLTLNVLDGEANALEVTTTVTRLANYTAEEVEANVAAALAAYLEPLTYPWSTVVRRNEVIAVVDGAAGVDTVDFLSMGIQGEDPVETDLDFNTGPPEDFEYLAQLSSAIVTVEDPA